jgi:hypothetical protein
MILLTARPTGPIGLYGLTMMTDRKISEMSTEELTRLIDDLRLVPNVQRRLPGIKLIDARQRIGMSREVLAQLVMDTKGAAMHLNLS